MPLRLFCRTLCPREGGPPTPTLTKPPLPKPWQVHFACIDLELHARFTPGQGESVFDRDRKAGGGDTLALHARRTRA